MKTFLQTTAFALIGLTILVWWQSHDPTTDFNRSEPNVRKVSTEEEVVTIGEKFKTYDGVPSSLPGDWPGFRGEKRDNIVRDSVTLADSWPADGPKKLWQMKMGEGHAAPIVYNGCFYVLDYDEIKKADQLRCFSLETGKEIWRRSYKVKMKRNHGFSRTVPAIKGGIIITFGPKCHVMATDAKTGDMKWSIDLVKTYGSKVPFWYGGQCPLIDGNTVVLAPAGKEVLLMGVDLHTGKILWNTPNPKQITMSHSSVMPMNVNGRKTYVYTGIGGMVGIAADGDDAGTILWQTNAFKASVIAPSPLTFEDSRIYMTAGYGAGSITLKIKADWSVEIVRELKAKEGMASEQQTPVVYGNKIFNIMPKDGGQLRNQLISVDKNDLTKILYSSGKEKRFGIGPYLIADKKMYILDDDGTLIMIDADADTYTELARHKVLDGHDAWGPLVIVNGLMILRDSKHMACIDLR